MDKNFRKLLLSELHMAVFRPGKPENLSDLSLIEAVTLNENLRSCGYTLKPNDMIALAASEDLDGFYADFTALIPEVKADPMYPDFPYQVMEMSEARFRLHQGIHYFSTYGIELLTGTSVTKGWLPDVDTTPKTEMDEILLDARVLDLIPEEEVYVTVLRIILGRRERPTLPETELILEAVKQVTPEELKTVKITFKENFLFIFRLLMDHTERDVCIRTISCMCAHTGDVLKCIHAYLREEKYHLRTSQKKTLTRLLECYPEKDFRENLMRSNTQREKNLVILRHLDFNQYSVSPAHREAVRALRSHELLSWEGQAEALLSREDPSALTFIAKRPAMLLRKLNRLVELGYSEEKLSDAICTYAKRLSPHTLVQTIRTFSQDKLEIEKKYKNDLRELRELSGELKWEWQDAIWVCSDRYQSEKDKYSRCSIERDMRLKISAIRKGLGIPAVQEEKKELLGTISSYRDVLKMMASVRDKTKIRFTNQHGEINWEEVKAFFMDQSELKDQIRDLEQKVSDLDRKLSGLLEKLDEETKEIEAASKKKFLDAKIQIERLSKEEEEETARINAEYEKKMNDSETFRKELERINQEHDRALKRLKNSAVIKRILSRALLVHFTHSSTPLKGKKVFLDLEAFDLAHSELELQEKSAEGGYIRSGMAYKIPEDAKYVRFFTYWNDRDRVDIDLHASGFTIEGAPLHIGWNGGFKKSGVVFSGDITHSNAAEYIDIDLSAPVRVIYANVNLFSGKPGFDRIEECFVGLMAVQNVRENVKHYNPANCFFTHTLRQHTTTMYYGYIDVPNRYVRFVGRKNNRNDYCGEPDINPECRFSLEEYLKIIFEAQQTQLVAEKEDAEVILTMGKSGDARAISLADRNFFLEC